MNFWTSLVDFWSSHQLVLDSLSRFKAGPSTIEDERYKHCQSSQRSDVSQQEIIQTEFARRCMDLHLVLSCEGASLSEQRDPPYSWTFLWISRETSMRSTVVLAISWIWYIIFVARQPEEVQLTECKYRIFLTGFSWRTTWPSRLESHFFKYSVQNLAFFVSLELSGKIQKPTQSHFVTQCHQWSTRLH